MVDLICLMASWIIFGENTFRSRNKIAGPPVDFAPWLDGISSSSDEVQRDRAVSTSNALARVSKVRCWIVTLNSPDNIVKALRMLHISATAVSLPLLLPSKSVFLMADTLTEVVVEEPEIEKSFARRARLSSTTHPVASVFQWISNRNRLSIIRHFVKPWASTFNLQGRNIKYGDICELSWRICVGTNTCFWYFLVVTVRYINFLFNVTCRWLVHPIL